MQHYTLKTTKHCWRKLKQILINGEKSHVDGLEDQILLRCQYTSKWSTFNAMPIKIPIGCISEIDKMITKLIWKCKGPRRTKIILKKNNKFRRSTAPLFKTFHKATVIKTWQAVQINLNGFPGALYFGDHSVISPTWKWWLPS